MDTISNGRAPDVVSCTSMATLPSPNNNTATSFSRGECNLHCVLSRFSAAAEANLIF